MLSETDTINYTENYLSIWLFISLIIFRRMFLIKLRFTEVRENCIKELLYIFSLDEKHFGGLHVIFLFNVTIK